MGKAKTAKPLLPTSRTCERYGVGPRTLTRWTNDERLRFPKPLVINSRRYWREADLVEWERSRGSKESA
jgi:predicted DNA-binding transcriptional regulator AlpA